MIKIIIIPLMLILTNSDFNINVSKKSIEINNYLISPQDTSNDNRYKILPKDERKKDKSLDVFLNQLEEVVKNKQKDKLLNFIDDSIFLSHSDSFRNGKEYFIERWTGTDDELKELWTALSSIIKLGGVFSHSRPNEYIIPYIKDVILYDTYPALRNIDCYTTVICTSKCVNVYKFSDLKSEIIGKLDYDVVSKDYLETKKDPSSIASGWYFIKSLDDRIQGYVQTKYFYNCSYYEIRLKKTKTNEWKIRCFVPFD